jgi:hypothetical protein
MVSYTKSQNQKFFYRNFFRVYWLVNSQLIKMEELCLKLLNNKKKIWFKNRKGWVFWSATFTQLSINCWLYKVGTVYSKSVTKMTKFNYLWVFGKVQTLSKILLHIFNASITNAQSLENESQKVWKELTTQSRYRLFKTWWKNYDVQLYVNFF